MEQEEKQFLPSKGRLEAAAVVGTYPKSELIGIGVVLILVACFLRLLSWSWFCDLENLIKTGITNGLSKSFEARDIFAYSMSALFGILGPFLMAILLVAVGIPIVMKRIFIGGKGNTSVPFPERLERRPYYLTIRLIGMGVFCAVALKLFINGAEILTDLLEGSEEALKAEVELLEVLIALGGAIMIMIGISEVLLERIRIRTQLSLTTFEAVTEERALVGNKSLKKEFMHIPDEEFDR